MDNYGSTQGTPAGNLEVGIGAWLSAGWATGKKVFWMLVLGYIILLAINFGAGLIFGIMTFAGTELFADMLNLGFTIFVGNVLSVGFIYMAIRGAKGERPEVGNLFEGFNNYLPVVGAMLLLTLIIVIPVLVSAIPLIIVIVTSKISVTSIAFTSLIMLIGIAAGTYLGLGFMYTPYLVVDKKTLGVESLSKSWGITNGHKLDLFLLSLALLGITLLVIILFGIAAIPLSFMIDMETLSGFGCASVGYIGFLALLALAVFTVIGVWFVCTWAHGYLALYAKKFGPDNDADVAPQGGDPYADMYQGPGAGGGESIADRQPTPDKDPFRQ